MEKSTGPVTLDAPIDALVVRTVRGVDEISQPFRYDLELFSDDPNIDPAALLGQPMTVHLQVGEGVTRELNGLACEFRLAGSAGSYFLYRVVLRPWLWFLSKTSGCRIFQQKSIPEIVKEVFRGHGFTDFEQALAGTYAVRDYVVQYRETDLNFISRLLEYEGIYYFFRHESGKHTLVLADSATAHRPVSGYAEVPYFPRDPHRKRVAEHVERWEVQHSVVPGAVLLTDFDFQRPTANLMSRLQASSAHAMGEFEVYDYPGEYETSSNGESYARVRLEELQAASERAEGFANARGITTGALFTLTDHPIEAQNREHLILAVSFTIESHALESDTADAPREEDVFQCRFLAADSQRPFRPARRARKPVIHGAQTAIVTGKSGEEIWTDEFGRVKVKFHWDRSDAADENSSCWVRVAQVWAGTNWGAMHIPRIGQEVIVEFLEGDPDRPIVTGRVYNGDNMPPYGLPANQTQSGIKSRSTKGGGLGNANEIRFEDKKGAEQLYVQAEKNQDILVKADESHAVGGSRSKSIGVDESVSIGANRTEVVGADETISIGANRTESVGANETITIAASRSESVGSTETVSIALARTTTVGAADVLNVGGAQMVDIGAAQSINVGAIRSVSVGGAESVSVGASQKVDVGANQSVSVGGKQNVDVGGDVTVAIKGGRSQNISKDDAIQVGQKLTIVVADEITLKSGSASIVLKKSGDITIKGKNIVLEASAKINVKASGDIVMKGSKIGQN